MGHLKFLKPKEIEKLLAVPNIKSEVGLRNRCIMQLGWESGMRPGELLRMRPRDISIPEQKIEVIFGKGDKSRLTGWRTDELTFLLKRWQKIKPKSKYFFSTIRSLNGKGRQVEPRSYRTQFHRYVLEALGEDYSWASPHVLRHGFAVDFLNRGGNIRTLQQILGHSKLSMTERYLWVTDDDVLRAVRGW